MILGNKRLNNEMILIFQFFMLLLSFTESRISWGWDDCYIEIKGKTKRLTFHECSSDIFLYSLYRLQMIWLLSTRLVQKTEDTHQWDEKLFLEGVITLNDNVVGFYVSLSALNYSQRILHIYLYNMTRWTQITT